MRASFAKLSSPLLAALLLAAASPASGEIYRWRDASGREHFTTDLQQVPAPYRRQAVEGSRAGEGGPAINYHSEPRRNEPEAAETKRKAPPAKRETVDYDCEALRKKARSKLKLVAKKERTVERREDTVSDIASSIYSEHLREKSLAKAEADLEAARADYERWRKLHLRRGAPPGCLR